MTARFIGWCPVCERDIRVRSGTLVHHGYQRPGFGYIVGDCPGVGFAPYELSPEAAQNYLNVYIVPSIDRDIEWLRVLRSPRGPDELLFERLDPATNRIIKDRRGVPETVMLTRKAADELAAKLPPWNEHYSWARKLKSAVARAESSLARWGAERERIQALIKTWAPKPLRTFDEETRRREETRREREEAKARARNEKLEVEIAKIQKRIDSAVRNKNAAALADIYESQKIQAVSGYRLSKTEALATLDRNEVWGAFGLLTPDGYMSGAAAQKILTDMQWGIRVPSRSPGVQFDYAPFPWPEALGGGVSKMRR